MDFRQYDNAIGRFVCIDPITHFNQSPYHFANNNPIAYNDPKGLDGGYALSWAANQAYLNSSLGSSSNWGQSAVGGSSIDYINNFESSAYSTSNPSAIGGIMGYYARESGYTGFSYMYADSENNIHGLGAGFYQYSKSGNGINGLGNSVKGIDLIDYGIGGLSEIKNLVENSWKVASNASKWKAAYQLSQTIGIRASTIRHGVSPTLSKVGRGLTAIAVGVTIAKIYTSSQVNSSDVLTLSMLALGSTGVGAPIATAYFVADLLTLAVTGKNIGAHLDDAVGQPLIDFSNGGN